MKIAVVADIHHGPPHHTKRGDTALDQMEITATAINAAAPDLVLDLGDRITDVDHATDLRLTSEVADAFKSIDAPIHHVCGNHDRYHLSVAENEKMLGQPLASEIVDAGTWQIVLWRADARITWTDTWRGFDLPEADYLWLSHQIASAEKPTLVVSHVPVSGHSQIGNYYFEANPDVSEYPQAARVRKALSQARVPVVCLAGHVHRNTFTQIDGIFHLTQQSLTESFTTGGAPSGAWGTLDLAAGVGWLVQGLDPLECTFTPGSRRWTPPLSPLPPGRSKARQANRS